MALTGWSARYVQYPWVLIITVGWHIFCAVHRAALCGQACVARILRVPGIESSGLAWAANCAPGVHGGVWIFFLALCKVCGSGDLRLDKDDSAVSDSEL